MLKSSLQGWGFGSVVERLPSNRKALSSVLSSGKKKKKKRVLYIQVPVLPRNKVSYMELKFSLHSAFYRAFLERIFVMILDDKKLLESTYIKYSAPIKLDSTC